LLQSALWYEETQKRAVRR